MALFIVQNLKRILTSELWCNILGQKLVYLPQTKTFLEKMNNIIFIYLLAPFIVQNFLKILTTDRELCGSAISGPKWPICPNEDFFRKPVNKPCSFHSCLSTCQKSKSDINLLIKYWRLKNTEISLAKSHFWLTWEPDFSQACSFRRMLRNHKNFRFTQIPDKVNDVIFLKSSKTMFLGHFWPFLVILAWWGFFQKFRLCHTQVFMGS